jgi:adenine/guanine/hypoxanthine permease
VFIVEREFAKAAAFAGAGALLSYFGFMHGEAVGIGGGLGVSPAPALAYAIVAVGLYALGRQSVALPTASEPIAAAAE